MKSFDLEVRYQDGQVQKRSFDKTTVLPFGKHGIEIDPLSGIMSIWLGGLKRMELGDSGNVLSVLIYPRLPE